jgi:nucleoid-associated protein YgaU
MSGELVKLEIKAYSNEQFTEEVANGEFRTLLNPEKYSYKYKIEQNEQQASGTSAAAPHFNKALPEDLELEFVFDRTGVIVDYGSPASDEYGVYSDEGGGVIDDIENFKRVVFDYNGDEHRPNYLIISWGTLLFKGTLTEMDITFKLFKPDGMPLRATAKAKFKGFVEDDLREAMENNSSPDLTHIRTVQAGDTLPLMAFRIYGDSKYYLEVAKANGITNFRKLKVGQKIFFPPIQKVS